LYTKRRERERDIFSGIATLLDSTLLQWRREGGDESPE